MTKKNNLLHVFAVLLLFQTFASSQGIDSIKAWLPLSEGLVSNVLINRYNLHVRNEAWADVDFDSWKSNFRNGFGTDGDRFDTNFFGHPIHGAAYYNASRSLGNNFWQSIPFAVVGSLTWEYLGENEIPSEIDFHTTTLGGIFLGECTYRISKYLLQPNRGAKNKIVENTYLTLLNPMSQFNRLVSKRAREVMSRKSETFPIVGELTLGAALPNNSYNGKDFPNFFQLQYFLRHGSLFKHKGHYNPFDHFTLLAWVHVPLEKIEEDFYFNVSGAAPLFRRKTFHSSIFTVSQHYDFINNQVFKIGTMGVTADLSWLLNQGKHFFGFSLNSGFLPFGGVGSEVAEKLSAGQTFTRDYMYGRGYLTKARMHYQFDKLFRVTMNFNRWVIYPIQDAKGRENSRLLQLDLMVPIAKKIQIGTQLFKYDRNARYPDLPEFQKIKQSYLELRIVSAYTFS